MTDKKTNWMKKSLLGSSTMPFGTAGFTFPVQHVHAADGSCCGGHHHHHHHEQGPDCDHDHEHDETCGHKHD